eukprot:SAG31_NODE_3078_length_4708_cov_1.870471_3_plen_50_part_00
MPLMAKSLLTNINKEFEKQGKKFEYVDACSTLVTKYPDQRPLNNQYGQV